MSRVRRKGGKLSNNLGDVTLNDYANAPISGKCRLRKPAARDFVTSVKNLSVADVKETWDAPDDTDDDSASKRSRTRRRTNSGVVEYDNGKVYSTDVWFLISDYIRPEDIKIFAGICKNSRRVINTPAFWFNLYKRYYSDVEGVPEKLRPECMTQLYGLKSRVIRALFFMYPPFRHRINTPILRMSLFSWQDYVVKRQCVSWWCGEETCFNFKLKRRSAIEGKNQQQSKQSFLEMLDDITANVEIDCVILRIVTESFVGMPSVLGWTLTSAIHDHGKCCVKLTFNKGVVVTSSSTVVVKFYSVTQFDVISWWNPDYPHSDKLPSIMGT